MTWVFTTSVKVWIAGVCGLVVFALLSWSVELVLAACVAWWVFSGAEVVAE